MINPLTQAPVFWEAFFLIVCRVGTILMIAPIFGNRGVPVQVKIAFTLLLSLILLPIATANLTALPESVPAFLLLVGRELLIGGLVGLAVLIVFVSLQAAGHIVGVQIGFSLSNVINPLMQEQSGVIDQFYSLLATLVFFSINGHHLLLQAVARTFDLVPLDAPGAGLPPAPVLLNWGSEIFVMATRISLPVTAALLLADVAMALVARSVPQLNVFVVGAPAKIIAGLAMLAVTVPVTAAVMAGAFNDLGNLAGLVLRGG